MSTRTLQVLAVMLVRSACVSGGAPADSAALKQGVHKQVDRFPGKVSLYAKSLKTGDSFGLRENEPVRTASTIKLAIMVECFSQAAAGRLSWTEPLTLTTVAKVPGSGLLQEFSDGDKLPLRDMVDLMIVMSDNTATNLILDRIGGDPVNAEMARLGLSQTRVMHKIGGSKSQGGGVTEEGRKPENAKWGIGRSSPKEMVTLLEKMYRRELVSPEASDEMLAILKRQRDHNGLGRDMKGITVANKSGALDHLRSDAGIIYAPDGPVAMAITVDDMPEVNWTPDNPGSLLISSLSESIVSALR